MDSYNRNHTTARQKENTQKYIVLIFATNIMAKYYGRLFCWPMVLIYQEIVHKDSTQKYNRQ